MKKIFEFLICHSCKKTLPFDKFRNDKTRPHRGFKGCRCNDCDNAHYRKRFPEMKNTKQYKVSRKKIMKRYLERNDER